MKKYILQFKGQALLLSDHGGHYIPERSCVDVWNPIYC